MRVSEQRPGTKTAIVRRAEEAYDITSKASWADSLRVAREQFERVLNEQAADSAKNGAAAGSFAVGIAVVEATSAVLQKLHELVPDLASGLPTSAKIVARTSGVEQTEGPQFGPAVIDGIDHAFNLQTTTGTNVVDGGEGVRALSAFVTSVLGNLTTLAERLVETSRRTSEEHDAFVREAGERETARSEEHSQTLAELEQRFGLQNEERERALAEKLAGISERFTAFLKLLDTATETNLNKGAAGLLQVMDRLGEVKIAGDELLASVTGDIPRSSASVGATSTQLSVQIEPSSEVTDNRAELIRDIGHLTALKRTTTEEKERLESERDALNAELVSLRQTQTTLDEGNRAKVEAQSELDRAISEKTQRRDGLAAAIEEKTNELDALEGRLAPLKAEEERLNSTLPGLRTEAQNLQGAIDYAKVASAAADARLAEAERALAGRTAEVYARETQAEEREVRLTARSADLDSREESVRAIGLENTRLSGLTDTLRGRAQDAEMGQARLLARNTELEDQLADLRRQLAEAKALASQAAPHVTASSGAPVPAASPPVVSAPAAPIAAAQVVAPVNPNLIAHGTFAGFETVTIEKGSFVPVLGRTDLEMRVVGTTVTIRYATHGKGGKGPFTRETSSASDLDDSAWANDDMSKVRPIEVGYKGEKRTVRVVLVGADRATGNVTVAVKVEGAVVVETKAAAPVVDMAPVAKLVNDLKPVLKGIAVRLGANDVPAPDLKAIEAEVDVTDYAKATKGLVDKLEALGKVAINKAGADQDGTEAVIADLRSVNGDLGQFVSKYTTALKAIHAALYDSALTDDADKTAVEAIN
jgi:hypothetical protein